ncbi:MAG TPA: carboxylesterase family protein [Galbitalea sp.]|nr:carboxylesterase family protein [Galbitalea sp.]
MATRSAAAAPIVSLEAGQIRGSVSNGISRFLGVPYAAAPIGPNRFALPAPHPGWSGIRDATSFGATAPQAAYGGGIEALLPTADIPGDEFLNLNVLAPVGASGLPVMVWVHGGSLSHGANALSGYHGTTFARDGVVYVAINYRLGSEGFSVIDGAPLNLGLGDVFAALRWVHTEIAKFGGDPGQVTVFGQSAGAILLWALVARPDAPDLCARAILQSGGPASETRRSAGRITRLEAKQLGIPATRTAFSTKSTIELVAAQGMVTARSTPITGGPAFAIALGEGLVPRTPMDAVLHGAAAGIPLLIGYTTEEYRLWFVPTGLMDRISATLFRLARIRFRIGRRILAAYRAGHPGASRAELFGLLATDILLRLPFNRIADARAAAGASTHVYEFTWGSPVQNLGAAHAIELGFVFDGVADPEWQRLIGDAAPQQLADDMHGAWVRFAKTGDPGWESWNTRRPVERFDAPASEVVYAPREPERAAWGKGG